MQLEENDVFPVCFRADAFHMDPKSGTPGGFSGWFSVSRKVSPKQQLGKARAVATRHRVFQLKSSFRWRSFFFARLASGGA